MSCGDCILESQVNGVAGRGASVAFLLAQFEDFEEDFDILQSESEVVLPLGLEFKYCTEHGPVSQSSVWFIV